MATRHMRILKDNYLYLSYFYRNDQLVTKIYQLIVCVKINVNPMIPVELSFNCMENTILHSHILCPFQKNSVM